MRKQVNSSDYIKEVWETQAKKHKTSHVASWGDHFAIDLEIQTISAFIKKDMNVLDIGCANGFSTFKMLSKKPKCITGVDFSDTMIKFALKKKKELGYGKEIVFQNGDVRFLDFKDEQFDLTYTTRVIINLPTWEEQMKGIDEALRVTKMGGLVVLSEAFWEPLVLLNAIRSLKQLSPLVEHDFNRYIKMQKLVDFIKSRNLQFEIIDFSSVYYLGSRFLRELVTEPNSYPGYSNPINKIFYKIEQCFSGGGFGIQQAVVITK